MPKAYGKKHKQIAKILHDNKTDQEKKLWYTFLSKLPVRVRQQVNIKDYIVDFCCEKQSSLLKSMARSIMKQKKQWLMTKSVQKN